MVSCYTSLSHSTADRRFMFGWIASNQSRSMWALDYGKCAFCHLSFSLLIWIGSTNVVKLISVPRLEIAKLVSAVRWWFGFAFFHRIWPQRTLNSFADACNTAGMKISTAKTEVLHLSRNLDQCVLQVIGATLKLAEKFKYRGVTLTSDGMQDEKLDI